MKTSYDGHGLTWHIIQNSFSSHLLWILRILNFNLPVDYFDWSIGFVNIDWPHSDVIHHAVYTVKISTKTSWKKCETFCYDEQRNENIPTRGITRKIKTILNTTLPQTLDFFFKFKFDDDCARNFSLSFAQSVKIFTFGYAHFIRLFVLFTCCFRSNEIRRLYTFSLYSRSPHYLTFQ